MKKLLVLLMVVLWAGAVSADVVTIAADEWCPYNCEPGSDMPGFMIEIAQYALTQAGHTLEYKLVPWSRAIDEARKGEINGIVGAAVGDAEDFVFPAEAQGLSTNAIFVKEGNPWRYEGPESLPKVILGVIKDYSYGDVLDAYIEKDQKEHLKRVQVVSGDDGLKLNLKKIGLDRIQAIVGGKNVFQYYLKVNQIPDKFVEAGTTGNDPVYVAFSPANPKSKEYADIVSKATTELRASGKLKEILDRYGLTDWK